jgi:uncharacterized protein involved in exopolysaccharide biosynthesis
LQKEVETAEKLDEDEYEEINLLDYYNIIAKNKKLIAAIVGIAVVATAVISLVMTPIYESKAIIAPAMQSPEPSGMAMVAAQFGVATSASSSLSEIVNLLKSNVVREKMIREYKLLPMLFDEPLKDKTEDQKIWAAIRYLNETLRVSPKQKDNVVELSMQFRDPQKAAAIVNMALLELNNHMSSEAKRVADTNRKYLESQLDKTSDPFIKAKIYTLIAQQVEKSMMAEVKENFAFKVLDPPKAPDRKIKPKRALMVVLAFIVSLFLAVFIVFVREWFRKVRAASVGN